MTLKHRIAGQPMDTETLLALAIEVAGALGAARYGELLKQLGLPQ